MINSILDNTRNVFFFATLNYRIVGAVIRWVSDKILYDADESYLICIKIHASNIKTHLDQVCTDIDVDRTLIQFNNPAQNLKSSALYIVQILSNTRIIFFFHKKIIYI